MKKSLLIVFFSLGLFVPSIVNSQTYLLDSLSNGSIFFKCGGTLYDGGGSASNYKNNTSYWRTICPATPDKKLTLTFVEFDIHPSDKLEIYSGKGLNGVPLYNSNSQPFFTNQELLNQTVQPHFTDTTGCLTVRLVADTLNTALGFKANIECVDFCQHLVAQLDSFFTKVDAQGNMQNFPIKDITDTIYAPSGNYSLKHYKSIDICMGDSIILRANPSFSNVVMPSPQSPSTCQYFWSFGDGQTQTIDYNNTVGHKFTKGSILDLNLTAYDTVSKCSSINKINTKVRISVNKIREIQEDLKVCSGEVFYLSVGNEEGSTVVVGDYDEIRGYNYEGAFFIPDGPNCAPLCLEIPITIDEYPSGELITSKDDILSICTNMEHSFIGDISIEVVCPNGQNTILKHFTHAGGADLGLAIRTDNGCLPENNPQGIGWNYCYSNQILDNPRGVISGSVPSPIDSSDIYSHSGYFQTPYQNATSFNQPTPSTGWEAIDLNGFETLIGCPFNGDWKLKVCDYWAQDNGYVFSWGIEFGRAEAEAMSISKIDSIKLIGEFITPLPDNKFALRMPKQSPGTINYTLEIRDNFGCLWDTIIGIKVLQGPIVDLGPRDTSIFEPMTLTTPYSEGYNYMWYPTNDTTNTITTPLVTSCDSIMNYYLVVSTMIEERQCAGTDYIQIHNNPTPLTPTMLQGNVTITDEESNILITWVSNALSYEVYRDDVFVAIATSRVYVDNTIVEGETYCYTVKAVNKNCESSISEPICKSAIGLNDLLDNEPTITLYPNPTSSKANLNIKGLSTKADIQVLDIQGRILKSYILNPNTTSLELDLSDLSKGLYHLRIDTKTNTIIKMIIKE